MKHKPQGLSLNRKRAMFVTSTALIGILFLVSIAGILTGRFRPFADVTIFSDDNNGTIVGPTRDTTVPQGSLSFKDKDGKSATTNSLENELIIQDKIPAQLSLQGLVTDGDTGRHNALPTADGQLTVLKAGGSVSNTGDVIARQLPWATTDKTSDNQALNIKLSYNATDAIERFLQESSKTLDEQPITIVMKEQYSLAVKVENVTDLSQPVQFPVARRGDFNSNNEIDDADFSKLVSETNKTQPSGTVSPADLNGNGSVEDSDYSIFFGNFGLRGAEL